MANRWKGNIIAVAATTSSGTDYTGKANGAWGLNSQLQQKQGGLWAKGQTVPNAPTIGAATKGNAQAIVNFTASTDAGGGTISSYTATSTPSGITGTSATSPITVTGLTNGTAYTFTVHANSNVGISAESSSSNSVTPSVGTIPSAPTIGVATVANSTSANITYTASSSDGGSTITSYTAVSSPGGITGTISQSGSGTITVTGLTTDTNYTFTVFATNAEGNSPSSAASNSVTPVLAIGESYEGGFYAGKINVSGIIYNLVVAPKATGQAPLRWATTYSSTSGATSTIDGMSNTAILAASGATYPAANFCATLNSGGGLNGKTDWYMPAIYELEVLYYNLKPDTTTNNTSAGSNPYAVSPEPVSQNYTSSSPTITSALDFRTTGTEYLNPDFFWTSTELSSVYASVKLFVNGSQVSNKYKDGTNKVRAIRKVLA